MGADCGDISMGYGSWTRFWEIIRLVFGDKITDEIHPSHFQSIDYDDKWGEADDKALDACKEIISLLKPLIDEKKENKYISQSYLDVRGESRNIRFVDIEQIYYQLEKLLKSYEDEKVKGEKLTWS